MGMRVDEFNDLEPAEFVYAWVGWQKLEESRTRQQWEQTRYLLFGLNVIQVDKKDRRGMIEMYPLPWEVQDPQSKATREEKPLTLEERRLRAKKLTQGVL